MKIYSTFKDYYDCGMKYGQSHIVYNRVRTVLGEDSEFYGPSIIGFCDQVFRLTNAAFYSQPKDSIRIEYGKSVYNSFWIKKSGEAPLNKKHGCPIVVMYNGRSGPCTVLNEHLGKFQFFKLFPPIEAFQQIEMWIGANLTAEKPIPDIDDKTMRDIKGFDKFSFKKQKKQ